MVSFIKASQGWTSPRRAITIAAFKALRGILNRMDMICCISGLGRRWPLRKYEAPDALIPSSSPSSLFEKVAAMISILQCS